MVKPRVLSTLLLLSFIDFVLTLLSQIRRCIASEERKCKRKHSENSVSCASRAIYQIPLTCRKEYIGQTGRCVSPRLREDAYSLNTSLSGKLAVRFSRCGCDPKLKGKRILGRGSYNCGREVTKVFFIGERGYTVCVSAPSLTLSCNEIGYLYELPRGS